MVVNYDWEQILSVTLEIQNNTGSLYNIGGFMARVYYHDAGELTYRELYIDGSTYYQAPVGHTTKTVIFEELSGSILVNGGYVLIYGEKNTTSTGFTQLSRVDNINWLCFRILLNQ
ncbi:hypothetical protein EZS27_041298 [termite gut metagenome]|uniref:Uncharacterized protein n=1 Tax=termite gut metagenome TaxID=433724 RepID=A0A5J4PDI4_9ZZZZ